MSVAKSVYRGTVLITGCSRGIGLGLVKEYLNRNFRVIATCRNPESAMELKAILDQNKQFPVIRLVTSL